MQIELVLQQKKYLIGDNGYGEKKREVLQLFLVRMLLESTVSKANFLIVQKFWSPINLKYSS
ncbi:MAG: hypothetical protein JWN83_1254 [Chitinophagaceae bacterium]|nr:hypothetical protein [Chitinophagaceae bacterium]